jgi:hypothetical protein
MRLMTEATVLLVRPDARVPSCRWGLCVSGFFLGSKELNVEGPKPGPVNARCLLGCVG